MLSFSKDQSIQRILKWKSYFPNYIFYSNGDIRNNVKFLYNAKFGKYKRNYFYGGLIKWRKHPQFGLLFTDIRDKNKVRVTLYKHYVIAILNHNLPYYSKKHILHFKDDNQENFKLNNLVWIDQGELNYIQAKAGKRDMQQAAEIMRKKKRLMND